VFALAGDISNEIFVDKLTSAVVERFGRIDYAVNCAGILGDSQPSTETSLEDFDRVNNVNYRGLWLCSRAQIRAMLKQERLGSHDATRPGERGSIVNIASQLGIVGRPSARMSLISSISRFVLNGMEKRVNRANEDSGILRIKSSGYCVDAQ